MSYGRSRPGDSQQGVGQQDEVLAGEDRLENFTFLSDELGAAFVMYCMTHKIPLPAKGVTKALRMVGDSLALVVSRNATTEMLQEFLDVH